MRIFDAVMSAVKPPSAKAPTAEEFAAAQNQATIQVASSAASVPKPSCLNQAPLELAKTLCAQKRAVGQQAVAGYALMGLGAATVDYDAAIRAAPCDWATLPFCGDAYKRTPSAPSTPSVSTASAKPNPSSTAALAPSSATTPIVTASATDKWLIIGGVLAGAVALGGVYYYLKKGN